jgi:hypothetical protein
VTAALLSPNDFTQDRSRWRAIYISAKDGSCFAVEEIEQWTAAKKENGDAGTFTMQLPLVANAGLAQIISPMGLVAIFAGRISSDRFGTVTSDFAQGFGPLPSELPALSYGDTGAKTVQKLASYPSCVFIGMVDRADEDYEIEGTPRAILSIEGRDLTKIFIDNDTYVPYTEIVGGDQGAFSSLATIVIPKNGISGKNLIQVSLDAMVKKDVSVLAKLSGDPSLNQGALAKAAKYGYPWDDFITLAIDPAFNPIPPQSFPNYSIQSGSAWANLDELRNYPIARLFVTEVGNLIFDFAYAQWNTQVPVMTIDPKDVMKCRFYQSDDDWVTALSLMPNNSSAGNVELSNMGFAARAAVADTQSIVKRWGYRWQEFVGQYLPTGSNVSSPEDAVDHSAFWKTLWTMHNDYFHCTLTVRGRAGYRAGQRVILNFGGANVVTRSTTPGVVRAWYIEEVRHSGQFGDGFRTELELRYPRDWQVLT